MGHCDKHNSKCDVDLDKMLVECDRKHVSEKDAERNKFNQQLFDFW